MLVSVLLAACCASCTYKGTPCWQLLFSVSTLLEQRLWVIRFADAILQALCMAAKQAASVLMMLG